jgi:hypothetical protein
MNSSGPISLAGTTAGVSIEIENGGNGTTQISLNDAAVRSLAGVPSGAITMPTNFYGKSNQFSFTISSDQTNANLRTLAVNAGWNQSSRVAATINSGVRMSSNSTGTPGLTINGSFPGGVTLTNGGTIVGRGGNGGGGGEGGGGSGSGGGLALSVSVAVTIQNNGTIAGGGGGGGGGGGNNTCYGPPAGGGGGGGGRSSLTNSSGGPGTSCTPWPGGAGSPGTFSAAGGGGGGGDGAGGSGGTGGGWGSTGSGGNSSNSGNPGGAGGSAGGAVTGNSNITWTATGTRYGGIS